MIPRVSFILLTFNQRHLIDEAVQAAFAQDYDNLEIVLSDDGSSDGTAERLTELVQNYRGPHRTIINFHRPGQGILEHFYDAVGKSSGDLIVVAAGDDVSLPQRASVMADAWQAAGRPAALFSEYSLIDKDGGNLQNVSSPSPGEFDPRNYVESNEAWHIPGCSAAYDRTIFSLIPLPSTRVWAEDYYFSLMFAIRSKEVVKVTQKLVLYRAHDNALCNTLEGGSVERVERQAARLAEMTSEVLFLTINEVACPTINANFGRPAKVYHRRLRRDAAYLRYRATWIDQGMLGRFQALLCLNTAGRIRWGIPRLFGLRGLALLRNLREVLTR